MKVILQSSRKEQRQYVFFRMEHRLLVAKEPLFWIFGGWKIRSFLSQKVDENMIFIDYWKFLLLNFSGVENTVFFCDRTLMKRWYLLITEMFLFWAFPWWKMWSFLRQKINGKMMFTDYWNVLVLGYQKVLVLSLLVMGNTVLKKTKSWCKDNIYLIFLSFLWYSRAWEIRFFVQYNISLIARGSISWIQIW